MYDSFESRRASQFRITVIQDAAAADGLLILTVPVCIPDTGTVPPCLPEYLYYYVICTGTGTGS